MNKLIMGLSYLGVLSAVSCDNDSNEPKIAPNLGKVSFSFSAKTINNNIANLSEDESTGTISFEAGDKIKLYIEDSEGKVAKYYTDDDRHIGNHFDKSGSEFTFVDKDDAIVIEGGFYLEAAENTSHTQ